jgi:hypothetical protein
MSEQPAFPTPEVPSEPEVKNWTNRLEKFVNHPLGRFTTALVTTIALLRSDQAPTEFAETETTSAMSIVAEANPDAPNVSLHLGSGEQAITLKLDDWNSSPTDLSQTEQPAIEPSDVLQKFITTQEPLTDKLGLTPANLEHPEAFTQWVQHQAQRTDLLEALHIQAGEPHTAHQLVNLSAAIVMSNVDYETNHIELGTLTLDEIAERVNYHKPIDKILSEHLPIQCEGYASATKAVFDELKKLFPKELQNTYMTTQSGIMEGHVWDLVMQVQKHDTASMAFIDATADDPSYSETQPAIHIQHFTKLLEGLFNKGLLNANAFNALVAQYEASRALTPDERQEVKDDQFYLEFPY